MPLDALVTIAGGRKLGYVMVKDMVSQDSAVNFESVNERNEGRYFEGLAATCPVAEDFTRALGDRNEPLLATALEAADLGRCPGGHLLSARPGRQ